MTYNYILALLV